MAKTSETIQMEPDLKISVVVPAYNAAGFIQNALNSILAQTLAADEVIVVDDGSTDNTFELVKRYNIPVRCLRQENSGVAAARNTGVLAARNEWIAFLDADDFWLSEKLARQAALLRRYPELEWASCGFQQRDLRKNTHKTFILPGGYGEFVFADALAFLGNWQGIHTNTMLFTKSLFNRVGGNDVDLKMGEDLDLWIRMAIASPKLGFVNQQLARYDCARQGSFSQSWGKKQLSAVPLLEKLNALLSLCDINTRSEGRKLVSRVMCGVLSTLVGRGSAGRCFECVQAMNKHGFGPVSLWLKTCCILPLPISRRLRSAYFIGLKMRAGRHAAE